MLGGHREIRFPDGCRFPGEGDTRGREENQRVSGSGGKIGGEGGKDAYRPRLEEEVVPRAALEFARSFPKFPECPWKPYRSWFWAAILALVQAQNNPELTKFWDSLTEVFFHNCCHGGPQKERYPMEIHTAISARSLPK